MRKIVASRTFEWPKKAQNGLRQLQKYYFPEFYEEQLYISFDTCTTLRKCQITHLCIGKIARWKLTEGFVALHSITGITFHYSPLLQQLHCSCFWYRVNQKKSSRHVVIALVRVLAVPYINCCIGSFRVSHNCVWIISQSALMYVMTCLETLCSQLILLI